MKTKRGCLLALILLTGLTSAKAQSSNLLLNSGFEVEGPASWGVTGTALRLERGNWHPRTGRWAFGIGNDEGTPDAYGEIAQEVPLPEGVAVGRKCFFSIWMMKEANYSGVFSLKLAFLSEDGQTLREISRPAGTPVRQEWQMARVFSVVPAGARRVRVACSGERMKSGTGQSFVWIDDTSLTME